MNDTNLEYEIDRFLKVSDALLKDIKVFNEKLRDELVVLQAECVIRGIDI